MILERIPQRLEHVRRLRQIPTLKEFHERIGTDEFSYSAVRNYHFVASEHAEEKADGLRKDEREAPVRYLVRVADALGIRLDWLATGEGPVTEGDFRAGLRKEEEEGFAAFVEGLRKGLGVEPSRATQELLWDLRSLPSALEDAGLEAFKDPWFMGESLGLALSAPLGPMQLDLRGAPWDAVEDYLAAVALGVIRLVRADRMSAFVRELEGEPNIEK